MTAVPSNNLSLPLFDKCDTDVDQSDRKNLNFLFTQIHTLGFAEDTSRDSFKANRIKVKPDQRNL